MLAVCFAWFVNNVLSELGCRMRCRILGALIMASLDNGMSLLNVQNSTQYVIKGAVLVAAVGFDMLGRRRG